VSARCVAIVESRGFQAFVTSVVIVAAVEVGLETSAGFRAHHGTALHLLDVAVTAAFTAEIAVRFLADGDRPAAFFRRPLNLFDTVLALGGWLPLSPGLLGVLRLVRLLRVLRLVRSMPKLRLLIGATLNSIPSISVLIGMLFYVYAVAAVFLFGANDPIHFANLPTSLLSMFRVVTLEDWTDIMYTQVHRCSAYGYRDQPELCTDPRAFGAFGALFFVSFVFVGTWVVLNLFIGIILAGMDEARREIEASPLPPGRTLYLLRQLRHGHHHAAAAAEPAPSGPGGSDRTEAGDVGRSLAAIEDQLRQLRIQLAARTEADGGVQQAAAVAVRSDAGRDGDGSRSLATRPNGSARRVVRGGGS